MRIFALTILTLVPITCWANGSFVQGAVSALTTGNISNLAFGSNNSAGNLIYAGVRFNGAVTVNTPTDALSNTYTAITASTCAGGTLSGGACCTGTTTNDGCLKMFYAKNIAGGSNNVSVTFSASQANEQLLIAEVSGLDTSSPLDQFGYQVNASSTTVTSPITGSTSTANEYVVGAATVVGGNVTTWTAGSGYTLQKSAERSAYEDKTVSATGAYSGTFTINSALANIGAIVTFKAAGGAAASGFNKKRKIDKMDGT